MVVAMASCQTLQMNDNKSSLKGHTTVLATIKEDVQDGVDRSKVEMEGAENLLALVLPKKSDGHTHQGGKVSNRNGPTNLLDALADIACQEVETEARSRSNSIYEHKSIVTKQNKRTRAMSMDLGSLLRAGLSRGAVPPRQDWVMVSAASLSAKSDEEDGDYTEQWNPLPPVHKRRRAPSLGALAELGSRPEASPARSWELPASQDAGEHEKGLIHQGEEVAQESQDLEHSSTGNGIEDRDAKQSHSDHFHDLERPPEPSPSAVHLAPTAAPRPSPAAPGSAAALMPSLVDDEAEKVTYSSPADLMPSLGLNGKPPGMPVRRVVAASNRAVPGIKRPRSGSLHQQGHGGVPIGGPGPTAPVPHYLPSAHLSRELLETPAATPSPALTAAALHRLAGSPPLAPPPPAGTSAAALGGAAALTAAAARLDMAQLRSRPPVEAGGPGAGYPSAAAAAAAAAAPPALGARDPQMARRESVDSVASAAEMVAEYQALEKQEGPLPLPHAFARFTHLYNRGGRVGIYTPQERGAILERFRQKRERRIWKKKIRYGCRKNLADKRLRVKGRFVKSAPMAEKDPNAAASSDEPVTSGDDQTPAEGAEEGTSSDDEPVARVRRHSIAF